MACPETPLSAGSDVGLFSIPSQPAEIIQNTAIYGCYVYPYIKTPSEINTDWNSGNPLNPFPAPPPPSSPPFIISANDNYSGVGINNFSVDIEGDKIYNTTNGSLITDLFQNSTELWNLTFFNGDYFNKTYFYVNISSNFGGSIYQSEITITASEKISNNTLTGSIYVNGTLTTGTIRPPADLYNFTFINSSYNTKSLFFNVPLLFNNSVNITNVSSTILNITTTNAYTGENLTTFSGYIYNTTLGYNESFSTITGFALVELINGSYGVFVDAPNYAIDNATNYQDVFINETTQSLAFGLYSNNSLRIRVYDSDTGFLISENIDIRISGVAFDELYNTSNGTLFVDNLTDGIYSVKFSGANYSLRTYSVSVADHSTQELDAYLSLNYAIVIFTIKDFNTEILLEDVSFIVSQFINGSYVVVESKFSDITGRTQMTYTPNVKYQFVLSLADYETKTFILDPIIFDSYVILLNQETTITDDNDYFGIGLYYDPKIFIDGVLNNFSFTIGSPEGLLSNYGFNITYPSGYYNVTGNNSIGETFNINFTITGADYLDVVKIEYFYDPISSAQKNYTYNYDIIVDGVGNNTFIKNKNNDYGIGVTERVIIWTSITGILSGIVALILGIIGGIVTALIGFGIGVYIGFIPAWVVIISVILSVVVLAWRGS